MGKDEAKKYLFLSKATKEPTLSRFYYTMYIEELFKNDDKAEREQVADNKKFGRHKDD